MGLRDALRAKLARAVDEVVATYRREQAAELHREVDSLRAELGTLRAELDGRIRAEADRLAAEVRAAEMRGRRDLRAAGEREAVASSARYLQAEMADALALDSPAATLEHALALAPSGGMALEFGVYTGGTLSRIAQTRPGGAVFGFDSFAGLPETWRPGFRAGAFGDVREPPDVPGAQLVVGLFAETLPGFLRDHPGPVDLLHLDADLYSSTATVLELVGPRLRPGSVVVFDEFFNYPGWEQHEARAWREHVDATPGRTFRFEAYTVDNEQVVVRLT